MLLRGPDKLAIATAKTASGLWNSRNHDHGVDFALWITG
jgi:hypothetical protein